MSKELKLPCEVGEISDGYHSFNELYEHRYVLFIALCKRISKVTGHGTVWRSLLHSDGTMYEGSFILGLFEEPGQQISYHFPLKLWDQTEFAMTLEKGHKWDGHTSADVLERIKNL